jgi:hypothetical protein
MMMIMGWGRIHKDVCYTCCSTPLASTLQITDTFWSPGFPTSVFWDPFNLNLLFGPKVSICVLSTAYNTEIHVVKMGFSCKAVLYSPTHVITCFLPSLSPMIYYLVEHIITLSDLPMPRSFICRVSVTD